MRTTYTTDLRIGILGGGQLARFLSLKAQEMGLSVRLLCHSQNDPAALVTKDTVVGSLHDDSARNRFLKDVDVVTFESEFVDASSLENLKIAVFPSVSLMNEIRDRKTQKDLLKSFKIDTAGEIPFEKAQDLIRYFDKTGKAFVLKKRLFGYDGYGTLVVKSKKDGRRLSEDITSADWIAEEFCSFKKELAFSIARNSMNQFYTLPLVETKQHQSKCDWVKGPVSSKAAFPLIKRFQKLMRDKDYVGLLSVELFQTSKGLLVNELAPRVHNTAHYSIEALKVSQFEAHLRAVLNMELPSKPKFLQKSFAMANLIGDKRTPFRFSGEAKGFLHWYGKAEVKPGRKMGHLTALDSSSERALAQVLKWRKKF